MLKFILLLFVIAYANYNINENIDTNNKYLKTIMSSCNEFAYNKTNDYDLFNSINNNDINNLKEVDKSNLTEIIEYNKIRLKCINKKESKIINDLIISYMALFGLLLIAYI